MDQAAAARIEATALQLDLDSNADGTSTGGDSGTDLPSGFVVYDDANNNGTLDTGEVSQTLTNRIDTPIEVDYYQHGGILQYVLRGMAAASSDSSIWRSASSELSGT